MTIEVTEDYGQNPAEYDLGQFLYDNRGDDEFIRAIPRLLAGASVTLGGGAQPIYHLQLLPHQPTAS